MHIAFRTDAAVQIGTGHVMRYLALATHSSAVEIKYNISTD